MLTGCLRGGDGVECGLVVGRTLRLSEVVLERSGETELVPCWDANCDGPGKISIRPNYTAAK